MRELKNLYLRMGQYPILSQGVSILDDDHLPGGLRGMHPHVPQGAPHRGPGKRKLHLFHIEPCTSHAFFAFFVDGQSQLGQLKRTLTIQHQEPDLWEYFPMLMLYYSFFEINLTLKFNCICFIQTSDEHALFSFWVHSQAWI